MPKNKSEKERDELARRAKVPTAGASTLIANRRRQTDELARKIFETDKKSQSVEKLKQEKR